MAVSSNTSQPKSISGFNATQLFTSTLLLAVTLFILWWGFLFLRDTTGMNPLLLAVAAIAWGVGGVALLFISVNRLIESFGEGVRQRVQPFAFVGPAVGLLGWFMFLPVVRTLWVSLRDADSAEFVGLSNYVAVFTERQMKAAFGNNILWMVIGTTFCVGLGLFIAVLADRSKFERLAKTLIFMPMAISFVGASVVWKFIYYYQPPGQPQNGLLNGIVTGLGFQPQAWISDFQPWNNLFLIVILIWMQTGYAMVICSAALKGVPDDLLEAGRIDGASEPRIFSSIILPYIKGTLITVATTILIFTLKIFDVVITMTGGQYNTEVIAVQFYRQFFQYRNFGYGSAIAIVLLLAVVPVMIYNLRQLSKQEGFR